MHSRGNVQQDARSQQDEQEGGCQQVIHLCFTYIKLMLPGFLPPLPPFPPTAREKVFKTVPGFSHPNKNSVFVRNEYQRPMLDAVRDELGFDNPVFVVTETGHLMYDKPSPNHLHVIEFYDGYEIIVDRASTDTENWILAPDRYDEEHQEGVEEDPRYYVMIAIIKDLGELDLKEKLVTDVGKIVVEKRSEIGWHDGMSFELHPGIRVIRMTCNGSKIAPTDPNDKNPPKYKQQVYIFDEEQLKQWWKNPKHYGENPSTRQKDCTIESGVLQVNIEDQDSDKPSGGKRRRKQRKTLRRKNLRSTRKRK
jgi:hypothetical protein